MNTLVTVSFISLKQQLQKNIRLRVQSFPESFMKTKRQQELHLEEGFSVKYDVFLFVLHHWKSELQPTLKSVEFVEDPPEEEVSSATFTPSQKTQVGGKTERKKLSV